MKQHILALGAAAALGLASVSHAIVVFGPDNAHPKLPKYFDVKDGTEKEAAAGVKLEQAAGGIGHMLFAPYYNVQGDSTTLINIANTDQVNGKAVKVRFRSAGNSDDVLDFTLLPSPGDVWSAGLGKLEDNWPVITTNDNSCILPVGGREAMWPTNMGGNGGEPMKDTRLPASVTEEVRKALMGEGYIEVLNMADIPPSSVQDTKGNKVNSDLYTNIKHVNGMAPCGNVENGSLQTLLSTEVISPENAATYGLNAPTGGLMGSWLVQNQTLRNSYSGNMTAVRALGDNGVPGYGNIIFAPQTDAMIDGAESLKAPIDAQYLAEAAGSLGKLTGDPLLITSKPLITPLWYDLPDMSTPLISAISTPLDQVMALDLARNQIFNSYVSDKDAENGVPMWTDWVVSQPTRRYYAAVNYAQTANGSDASYIVWNNSMGGASDLSDGGVDDITTGAPADNVYDVLQMVSTDYGPFACLRSGTVKYGTSDTEEFFGTTVLGTGAFSPGRVAQGVSLCGEVFVLSFSADSVFDATVTRQAFPNVVGAAGLAQINFSNQKGAKIALPAVGFAATSYGNQNSGISYGATMPHFWN